MDDGVMRRLMTFEELSDATQTPQSTLRNMLADGRGPTALKIGRNLRFRPEDVEAWLKGLEVKQGRR